MGSDDALTRGCNRGWLIDQIKRYTALWPQEHATAERFLEFVRSQPRAFDRSCRDGHVTGSAWVVSPEGDEALLTHHRKLDAWLQLGGHADGCENLLEVALQEAREESGIDALSPLALPLAEPEPPPTPLMLFDLDVHRIPAHGDDPPHDHYDARIVLVAHGSRRYRVSDESHDLAWVPIDRIEHFTREDSMIRMRDKWSRIAPTAPLR